MSFPIPPAFEYVGTIAHFFWPFVLSAASFGLGYICGGCAQRG